MSEQRKVPKLRFPEFTDDWEQHKLNEITSRVQGNNGRLNLQTLTISAGNGWMKQEDRFSANIAGKEQKNYTLLKQGELAYNHGNSKLAKYGAVFELKDFDEALVPRVYHSFRVNNKTNSSFIEYLFATKILDKELGKLVSSGARMDGLLNIGYEDFVSIKITVPSFEEQQKIASYFRKVDEIITLHQRKCEVLKKLKKGLLQKMFPKDGTNIPEIRFPEFTDAWEQREFSSIAERISKTSQSSASLPSIEFEDIISEQGLLNKDLYSKKNVKSGIKFECNDILFGKLRPYLKNWLFANFTGVAVGDFWVLRGENISPLYLYYLIQTDSFMAVANTSTGTKMPRSDWKLVSSSIFFKPTCKDEQSKIGNLFRELDSIITLHQRKLEVLKKLKKGLLQQMFV